MRNTIIVLVLLYFAYKYYKNNLTPEKLEQKAEEEKQQAAIDYEALRSREYALCNANSYGNASLSEGEQWNKYRQCTANVDAIYPKP